MQRFEATLQMSEQHCAAEAHVAPAARQVPASVAVAQKPA